MKEKEQVYDKHQTESQEFEFATNEEKATKKSPVKCLGKTFPDEKARRDYFIEELRKKLQDPEFRKIEGFPIGSDEDILALSDPPYYTACPNPWIADFVAEWEAEKPQKPPDYRYHRKPFAADVSEGKNDPIYNAHSYHTKVPHKAVMRYILHYTEPGDIVFDGFCGSGMTGVAAQMCGDKKTVESLGYKVEEDGKVLQEEIDDKGKKVWLPFSKLGPRRAVLNDLSPAATFIAYNYNTPIDANTFEKEARRILREVEDECGWMYETFHTDGKTKGKINYTVWSDVFVCPNCSGEVVFWDVAVDKEAGKVKDVFPCPHCIVELTKKKMERAWISKHDPAIDKIIKQIKQVPTLINYNIGKRRSNKSIDRWDLDLIERINHGKIPYWYPKDRMVNGSESRRNDPLGITNVHHFFSKKSLWILSAFQNKINNCKHIHGLFQSLLVNNSKMGRYGKRTGNVSGTLYIPSLIKELNVIKYCERKIYGPKGVLLPIKNLSNVILQRYTSTMTVSSNAQLFRDNSADYLFIDPPFGENLMYSELNYIWESFLKVWTNSTPEAIKNNSQKKGINEYRQLMYECFKIAYRILKPGRWMTVEFSNTQSSVWNSIQTALTEAGFIVANVSSLDKQQGSFKAVTTPTAVKQDLVISAYKPNDGFEERFDNLYDKEDRSLDAVWEFVRNHLKYLPVVKKIGDRLEIIPDREPRIIYDRLVAFYVRKGYLVSISSAVFQKELLHRFIERDSMIFLPDQIAEYDSQKLISGIELKQEELFVHDESTAIQWLRRLLKEKPGKFSDINPFFMKQLGGWSKNEKQLDLRELLNQNFICYDGKGKVPEQIHSYLSTNWKELRNLSKNDANLIAKAKDRWYVPDPNKAADLEKLRERSLLKEFETYKSTDKKMRVFRLEAVRAGFKKAWQEKDYKTIIFIAEKIPSNVLEEDPKLLMWYDQAITRIGGEM